MKIGSRNRLGVPGQLVWLAIGLGALYWILESVLERFAFHPGGEGFLYHLLTPESHAITHRLIVICIFIVSSAYAQFLINNRKRAEKEQRESEEKFRTLVESASEVIIIVDGAGRIVLANAMAEEVFGYDREEMLGQTIELLVPERFREAHVGHRAAYLANPGARPMGCDRNRLGRRKDGSEFPMECSRTVIETQDGPWVMSFIRDITERRRTEEALRESEEKIRDLLESAPDAIVTTDSNGRIILVNSQTEKLFGYSRDELLGKPLEILIPDRFREAHVRHRSDYYTDPHTRPMGTGIELTARRKDGSELPVDISLSTIQTKTEVLATAVIRDVTDRKRAEEALRESEEKFRNLADNAVVGVFQTNLQGDIQYVNDTMVRMLEFESREEMISSGALTRYKNPEDRAALIEALRENGSVSNFEVEVLTRSGKTKTALLGATLDGDILAGTLIDITDRRQAEETIRHLAYHDTLTDLPNRTLFGDRLTLAVAQAHRKEQMLAVLFLDLDQFKVVNDTMGHALGDEFLQAVAKRLTGLVRDGDTVARVGGDEFALLLPEIAQVEEVMQVAERVLEGFRRPWAIQGHEFHVSTSIGIAMYPNDGDDGDSLLQNADTAMYRAKDRGSDNYQFYTPTMSARITERIAVENGLRRGLERGEFLMYYQPQVNIGSGRIVGVETLVRWQHPERGLVSPTEFIPVAEETGLIVPLGEWVLRAACAQNKAWQEAGLPALRVAVNLSARQFQQRDLIDAVARALEDTGLDPQSLQLEITEGAAMEDADFTITTLRNLKEMGVTISVDDFGTGYSSLSYLKRFPIDVVKIDRSFVRDITVDENDAAIAATIIAMAHNLKLGVVAEGVETEEQLAFLKERGCDEFQGYLFSKPVPAAEIEKMLAQDKRQRAKVPVKPT